MKFFLRFWAFTSLVGACYHLLQPDSQAFSAVRFAQFMQQTSYYSSWSLLLMAVLGFFILPYSFLQKFGLGVLVIVHNLVTCLLVTWLCLKIPGAWAAFLYPVLCLFLGPLMHFAWFVGFYSWALTWRRP